MLATKDIVLIVWFTLFGFLFVFSLYFFIYLLMFSTKVKRYKKDYLLFREFADPMNRLKMTPKIIWFTLTLQFLRPKKTQKLVDWMFNLHEVKRLHKKELKKSIRHIYLLYSLFYAVSTLVPLVWFAAVFILR